ncbi:transposase [Mesorhizobium sp. AR07]|uniref:transposase n=1 Tax=Mesorhizobium sp. AR07 TaxID=2865838 RepID=UPI0039B6F0D5
MRSAISSRSTNDRYRPESGFAEDLNIAGGIPPAFRNHLVPTGCDTPASSAASSLLSPAAIARQNLICSSRPAKGGRPGEGNGARPDRADRRFRILIATSNFRVLRRPLESAQYACSSYSDILHAHGIQPSMSRVGNPYDNARAESFMKTLKQEEVAGRAYRDASDARRRIASFIEDVYNRQRLHSALDYLTPEEYEQTLSNSPENAVLELKA